MEKSPVRSCRNIQVCRFVFLTLLASGLLYFITFFSIDFPTLSSGNIPGFTFLFHNFSKPSFDFRIGDFTAETSVNSNPSPTIGDHCDVANTTGNNNEPVLPSPKLNITKNVTNIHEHSDHDHQHTNCIGKYIYVHNLPSEFNTGLLKNCGSFSSWFNFCPYLSNMGFGPKVEKYHSKGVFWRNNKGWFKTSQFSLEVIFHNRMKHYKCLTNDPSLASAVFVPFYAGLDLARFLWGFNTSARDELARKLVIWLGQRPEWKRMFGRDHFLVGGRVAWDFRRQTENKSDWGSKLMFLPESKNMTMLSIETSLWSNDFAIPYPTYFHPSNDRQVLEWQRRMRRMKRPYLFSFVGAPRPGSEESIRGQIIKHCLSSGKLCKLLDCNTGGSNCDEPANVMNVFERSVFCLQPSGDSFTRRSTFDSILAGCVPVFFNPASGYSQYSWHFPKNHTKYSVFIPEHDVKERKVSISEILLRVPKDEVFAMREEVIEMIPRIIYADPRSTLETFEDAFDIALKNVLERVKKVRKEMKEGRDPSIDFAELNPKKFDMV